MINRKIIIKLLFMSEYNKNIIGFNNFILNEREN